LHHAAAIAERARKKASADDLFKEIADFALWLFTAVHKLEGPIGEIRNTNETPLETVIRIRTGCSDLLWHRYPRFCPLCYERRTKGDRKLEKSQSFLEPCDCLSTDHVPQEKPLRRAALVALRGFSEETRNSKPKSIDGWQEMFETVFRANLRHLTLTDATSHLLEELGEASDAMIRMSSYRNEDFVKGEPDHRQFRLEAQVADVFSWLFAIVLKADLNRSGLDCERSRSHELAATGAATRLSEIIWDRYGCEDLSSFWCPFCERIACECPLIFVPAARSVEDLKMLCSA
jgi:NTP pyrophosphatase (non-canonical NTP hydrolase)